MSKRDNGDSKLDRRDFFKTGSAAVAGAALLFQGDTAVAGAKAKADKEHGISKHNVLGRTGFKVSDISMGCGQIAEPNVVRYAYDRGVNYFDTAEGYENGGSETKIGKALKHLDRSKVFIVTKLKVKDEDTEQTLLDRHARCLERLQTSYTDALYTHGVSEVKAVKSKAFHAACRKLKAGGKIKHVGISSHGPRGKGDSMEQVLLAAVDDGRFDLMLLVYNFMKQDEAERVLAACKSSKVGATIMKANPGVLKIEPFDPDKPSGEYAASMKRMQEQGMSREEAIERIKGWTALREEAKQFTGPFMKKYGLKAESELHTKAIQWVLRHPDQNTICVSMPSFDLVDRYVPLSGTKLTRADHQLLREYRLALGSGYCRHACNACAGACPGDIPVSTIMRYAAYFQRQGREKLAMRRYIALGARDASACLECAGHCAGACPHGLAIQASLFHAHTLLSLA